VINKKTLKSILSFTENQNPAPSFIVIYILMWLFWHNQLFSDFIDAQGDFLTKVSTSLTLLEENQYLVVFFLTCLVFLGRLMINYFSFKSRELLNSADDDFVTDLDDQKFAQNADIANIMATLVKTKQQLVDSKAREKKLTSDKNDAIKKLLSLQHELDEARADIDMLNKVKII
tara:strand:- start:1016 stop:1537 length:522 start_codon:yes stop_codon:yes gene_type:complete